MIYLFRVAQVRVKVPVPPVILAKTAVVVHCRLVLVELRPRNYVQAPELARLISIVSTAAAARYLRVRTVKLRCNRATPTRRVRLNSLARMVDAAHCRCPPAPLRIIWKLLLLARDQEAVRQDSTVSLIIKVDKAVVQFQPVPTELLLFNHVAAQFRALLISCVKTVDVARRQQPPPPLLRLQLQLLILRPP